MVSRMSGSCSSKALMRRFALHVDDEVAGSRAPSRQRSRAMRSAGRPRSAETRPATRAGADAHVEQLDRAERQFGPLEQPLHGAPGAACGRARARSTRKSSLPRRAVRAPPASSALTRAVLHVRARRGPSPRVRPATKRRRRPRATSDERRRARRAACPPRSVAGRRAGGSRRRRRRRRMRCSAALGLALAGRGRGDRCARRPRAVGEVLDLPRAPQLCGDRRRRWRRAGRARRGCVVAAARLRGELPERRGPEGGRSRCAIG